MFFFVFTQNGYKMQLISVDNCAENNVLMVDKNFTATLSSDCFLTTVGCVTSKGFKEAKVKYTVEFSSFSCSQMGFLFAHQQVKYTVTKNGNELLSGHPDICNALDHKTAEQKEKLEMFGFPTECPVPEGRKCMDGTKKVDISKFKNFLPMAAGHVTVHQEITHDTV